MENKIGIKIIKMKIFFEAYAGETYKVGIRRHLHNIFVYSFYSFEYSQNNKRLIKYGF